MRGSLVCVVLFACGDNAEPLIPAVPLASGLSTLTLSDDGTTLTFARRDNTLLTMRGDAFAVGSVDDLDSGASFDPYWLYVDGTPVPEGFAWREQPTATPMKVVRSNLGELVLRIDHDRASNTVTFHPAMADSFSAVLTGDARDGAPAFLRIRADADPDEGFYGLGEWADSVMHRGKLRPMQMELDTTTESSDNENHVPVPLLIGTRGWGVFAKSDHPGVFDVARQSDTRIELAYGTGDTTGTGLEWYLFSADQPLDVLPRYFEVTGSPGLPAEWAYGPLLWRDEHRDQAQAVDDITQIRSRKLAVSGVWFDRPYSTGVETFDFSATKFPDPTAMLQAHHDAGLRYAVWQAPYTAPSDNEDPAGANFDISTQMGFFPPTVGLLLNPWSKPIDFTNPAAYAWWKANLTRYTKPLEDGGLGVEGFKLDYAEDVVLGISGNRTPWKFADGSDERTMHHNYQLLYHQVHRDVLADGGFLLTRTGRWGDQTRGVIIWPGDLDATFDHFGDQVDGTSAVGGLPTALSFGLGLSASGFPFSASDTGGYRHSPANKECWVRWVEANAVWSVMQIGDSSSVQPWEFNAENGRDAAALAIYKKYTTLHIQLFPYAWTYAQAIAATGRPIVRPFGLAYPEVGVHPSDQYLFGDSMLSAPVITAGQTAREMAFPPGDWIDWWTGESHDGGATGSSETVQAPLDTLPLFIARGGIIPMLRDTTETLAPVKAGSLIDSAADVPGVLTVRVAPSATMTSFTVFDNTVITQQRAASLTVSYAPGPRFDSGALFEVITTPAPPAMVKSGTTVLAERASLAALKTAGDGWFWEPATGGTLWIGVTAAATITAL